MKKLIAGITAMLLVTSMTVYAGGGGKKKAKKAARKTECCTQKVCCDDGTKCNSVKYAEKTSSTAEAKISENEKQGYCDKTGSCTKKD